MWPFLFPTSNLCTLIPLVKNRPALASKPSTSDTYRATGQLQPQGAPTCQPAKRHPPMPENIRRATIYDIAPMTIYETVRPVRLALGAAFPRSFLHTEIQDTPEQSATIAMETRYTTNGLTSAKCSLTSHAKITAKRTARYAITLPPQKSAPRNSVLLRQKRQYKTKNKIEIPAAKHKMTVENLVTITITPFSSSTRTILLFYHLLCMRFFVNGLESM